MPGCPGIGEGSVKKRIQPSILMSRLVRLDLGSEHETEEALDEKRGLIEATAPLTLGIDPFETFEMLESGFI